MNSAFSDAQDEAIQRIGRAGATGIVVPSGAPMQLTGTGTQQRHAITLILHDSSKPPSTEIRDWTAKGLCTKQ